jgi:hypothetical protein
MKKLFLPILLSIVLPAAFSCSSSRLGGYTLTEADAAAAIRQMLETGAREGVNGSFTKDKVMETLFPEPLRKTLATLQQLGLTNELDRFTTTLGQASEKAAQSSIPVFVSGINRLTFPDAIQIIKSGGSAGTQYLRSTVGTDLRNAIKPSMQSALAEYKLEEQWAKIIKPAQALVGNRLNLDLPTLMAGMVSESMFQKIEQKELEIRSNASARNTQLLQKVFSRNW